MKESIAKRPFTTNVSKRLELIDTLNIWDFAINHMEQVPNFLSFSCNKYQNSQDAESDVMVHNLFENFNLN